MPSPAHTGSNEEVPGANDFGTGFDHLFDLRQKEADDFYASRVPKDISEDARSVMRQALSGMLWSKQFYHYDVLTWLSGDPGSTGSTRGALERKK